MKIPLSNDNKMLILSVLLSIMKILDFCLYQHMWTGLTMLVTPATYAIIFQ